MQVGQKVRLCRIVGRGLAPEFISKVGEVGVIKKEKILDGGRFGYIVAFSDHKATWFFPNELEVIS